MCTPARWLGFLCALALCDGLPARGELVDGLAETRNSPYLAVPERVKADPHTGGSSYRYAFELPPGTGITPELALTYSSLTQHTEFGYGWSLGLSKIERSTRFGVPGYDGADTFELDGELLVPDPTEPNRFHLARSDLRRIRYVPAAAGQSDAWIVTRKDGSQLRYGSRSDQTASVLATGPLGTGPSPSGQTFRWLLDEAIDPRSNAYRIDYEADTYEVAGQVYVSNSYPRRVRYSFHPGQKPAQASRLVELEWGERGYGAEPRDRPTSYRSTFKIQVARRLVGVRVGLDSDGDGAVSAGEQVRRYELVYAPKTAPCTTQEPEACLESPFSKLAAIQRYGSDDGVFPTRTELAYSRPGRGFQAAERWTEPSGESSTRHLSYKLNAEVLGIHDLDGDGLVDRIHVTPPQGGAAAVWQVWSGRSGEPDAFESTASSWSFACAGGGTGCGPTGTAYELSKGGFFGSSFRTTTHSLVDLDGDGLLDWVHSAFDGANWTWYRNTGDGFLPPDGSWTGPQAWSLRSHISSAHRDGPRYSMLADVNGDGRPDHVQAGGLPQTVDVSLNVQTGFAPPQAFSAPTGADATVANSASTETSAWGIHDLVDINGDGLPDWVTASGQGGTYDVFFGTGDGFQSEGGLGHRAGPLSGNLSANVLFLQSHGNHSDSPFWVLNVLTDINGDGMPDLVAGTVSGSSLSVHFGLGDGLFMSDAVAWASPAGSVRAGVFGSPLRYTEDLVDVDSDGLPDYVRTETGFAPDWELSRHPGPPGLLAQVTNEFGGVSDMTYLPRRAFEPALASGHPTSLAEPDLPAHVRALQRPMWLLQTLATRDGRWGTQTAHEVETFDYAEIRCDTLERAFAGARQSERTDAVGTRHRSVFHQVTELRGQLEYEEVEDSGGAVLRGRDVEWQPLAVRNPASPGTEIAGATFAVKARETQWLADPLTGLRQERTVLRDYDDPNGAGGATAYGNLVSERELGADGLENTADDRIRTVVYVADPISWRVGYPAELELRAGDGTRLSLEQRRYDGSSTHLAAPVAGLQTERLVLAESAGTPAELLVERWAHDAFGQVVDYWSPRQNATDPTTPSSHIEYDGQYGSFAVAIENALGHSTRYDVDPGLGELRRLREPSGYLQCWDFDPFGRIAAVRDAASAVPEVQFSTASCGRSRFDFDFVDLGGVPGFGVGGPDLQHVRATSWADAQSSVESRRYFDGLGRIYFEATESESATPSGEDGRFFVTRREYGPRGELRCEWLPERGDPGPELYDADYPGCQASPTYDRRLYRYDGLQRVEAVEHGPDVIQTSVFRVRDHDGLAGAELVEERTVHSGHAAAPDRYREIARNAGGAVVSACERPTSTGACAVYTFLRRDGEDRLLRVDGPDVYAGGGVDENLLEFEYDTAGRRVLVAQRSGSGHPGREWRYSYDADGAVTAVTPPRGPAHAVHYHYDALGRLRMKDLADPGYSDPAQPGPDDVLIQYDGGTGPGNLGRVTEEIASGVTTRIDWDLRGAGAKVVRAYGGWQFATTTQLDLLDRPSATIFPDGETVRIDYDRGAPAGVWLDRADGQTSELLVDQIRMHASGRVKEMRHVAPDIAVARAFPSGDGQRMGAMSVTRPGPQGFTESRSWLWDDAGNLVSAAGQSFEYDGMHRLVKATGTRPSLGGDYGELVYEHDDAGNLLRRGSHALAYGVDETGLHEMTDVLWHYYENPDPGVPSEANPCPSWEVADPTDANGDGIPNECQCGDADANGYVQTGDLLQLAGCLWGPGPCTAELGLADANGDGHLQAADLLQMFEAIQAESLYTLRCERRPEGVDLYEEAYRYEQDEDGQVTRRDLGPGSDQHYQWDAEGRLTAIVESGSVAAAFEYDGTGERTRKTTSGEDQLFVSAAFESDLLASRHRKHVFLFGERLLTIDQPGAGNGPGSVTGEQRLHYFTDHLGSQELVTDGSGQILHFTRLTPFGELHELLDQNLFPVDPSALASEHLYAGHRRDPESNLDYMGARYYDPLIGRFLSPDPALLGASGGTTLQALGELPQGLNGYAYAQNQPVSLRDPNGEFDPVTFAIAVAIKSVISLGVQAAVSGELPSGKDVLQSLALSTVSTGADAFLDAARAADCAWECVAASGSRGAARASAAGAASGIPVRGVAAGVGRAAGRVGEALAWDIALEFQGVVGNLYGLGRGAAITLGGVVTLSPGMIGKGLSEFGMALIPRYGFWSGPGWGQPDFNRHGSWPGPFSDANVIEAATYDHDQIAGRPGADLQLIKRIWSRHDLGPFGQVYRVGLTAVFSARIGLGMDN